MFSHTETKQRTHHFLHEQHFYYLATGDIVKVVYTKRSAPCPNGSTHSTHAKRSAPCPKGSIVTQYTYLEITPMPKRLYMHSLHTKRSYPCPKWLLTQYSYIVWIKEISSMPKWLYIYTVHMVRDQLHAQIPYSRKLPREKTFTDREIRESFLPRKFSAIQWLNTQYTY